MWRKIPALLLLTCVSPIFAQVDPSDRRKAQQDADDRKWAQKTGLPLTEVQAIRAAAGILPTNFARIMNLDVTSLKERKHILLVEGAPCIRLHVIKRGATGFTEVWSLGELPRPAWKIGAPANRSARGICPQAPRPASAHATPDGRIVLEVPILLDPFERTRPVETYTFTWDGGTYILADGER
jgi:hypothetical protein